MFTVAQSHHWTEPACKRTDQGIVRHLVVELGPCIFCYVAMWTKISAAIGLHVVWWHMEWHCLERFLTHLPQRRKSFIYWSWELCNVGGYFVDTVSVLCVCSFHELHHHPPLQLHCFPLFSFSFLYPWSFALSTTRKENMTYKWNITLKTINTQQ